MTKSKNPRTGAGSYLSANLPIRDKSNGGTAKASKKRKKVKRKDMVELHAHTIVYEVDHNKPVQVFPSRWDLSEVGARPDYHWERAPNMLVTLYQPISPGRAISLLKAVIAEIEKSNFPKTKETHERDQANELMEGRILGEEIRGYYL